jgi:hypothetical protein
LVTVPVSVAAEASAEETSSVAARTRVVNEGMFIVLLKLLGLSLFKLRNLGQQFSGLLF